MNAEPLERHQVKVIRRVDDLPIVTLDKARLLLIVVTLLANATAAAAAVTDAPRIVTISAGLFGGELLRIRVEDFGEGTRLEHLPHLFAQGFGISDGGYGFGLHTCELAAGEMGGTLLAASEGLGSGTTFILEVPVIPGCE